MSIPLYLWGSDGSLFSREYLSPCFSYTDIVGLVTPSIRAVVDLPYLSFGLHPLFTGFSIFFSFND